MKEFDVKEWKNTENLVTVHGNMYEEPTRGDIFIVSCPECGSFEVKVEDEEFIDDSDVDICESFWAEYRCQVCNCKFRGRFKRKFRIFKPHKIKNRANWLITLAFLFGLLSITMFICGILNGFSDDPSLIKCSIYFAISIVSGYLIPVCIDKI